MFLDTTFLVDFLRGKQHATNKLEQMEGTPLYTSEINVFELIEGAHLGEKNIQEHLEKIFILINRITVLPFDRRAALKAGMIAGFLSKQGKRIGTADCLIAGVALANGMKEIITDNKEHFERIPEIKVITY